jgi:hypothetical protein
MRIRPAYVTLCGSLIALAAIGVVVFATTPAEASPGLIRLLWLAVFLFGWGILATVLLVLRQTMAQAIWVGFWPAFVTVGTLMAIRRGMLTQQLLLGIILATLCVSVVTWWRLRRAAHD